MPEAVTVRGKFCIEATTTDTVWPAALPPALVSAFLSSPPPQAARDRPSATIVAPVHTFRLVFATFDSLWATPGEAAGRPLSAAPDALSSAVE